MANFSAEIFDCGLLQARNSSTSQTLQRKETTEKTVRKQSIVYRIFHMGDSTPTSDEDKFTFGRSKQYHSESDNESEKSCIAQSQVRLSTTKKSKSIFGYESSDYDSDDNQPAKPKSHSILNDFLSFKNSLKKTSKGSSRNSGPISPELKPSPRMSESGRYSDSSSNGKAPLYGDSKALFTETIKIPELTPLNTLAPPPSMEKSSSSPSSPLDTKFKDLLTPPSNAHRSTTTRSKSRENPLSRTSSESSLQEKYGNMGNILGTGAFATVKLCCPLGSRHKYAVKEFRKKKGNETSKEYIKKLQAEFCIASSLDHINIISTVDLIQDCSKAWCVVMEYCEGGDLYARIHNLSLEEDEKNCYLVQIGKGVSYLHSVGVAHRDLKPENILVSGDGRVLKITDFGVSTVFKSPFGAKREKQIGVTGSGPYIAPEEYSREEYDSELVDVWAMGIIGYVMATNSIPWRSAEVVDTRFRLYTESKCKFSPFERVSPGLRALLVSFMLMVSINF
jgi:protein-serine/threonine kinase